VTPTSRSASWRLATFGRPQDVWRCRVLGDGLLVGQVQTRWMTTGVLRSPAVS
jgi:hypothetical protein